MAAEIEAVGNAEDEAGGKAEDEAGGKVEDETGEEAEDEASGNAEEASREDKRYDAWGRELREGEDGMLTGRPMLWLAGFRTFLEAPVFGVTRENLSQRVGENLSDKGWMPDLEAGGIHNGPLTVLVCSGLAGFVPLLAFAVMLLRRFTRALLPLLTGNTDRVTGSEAEIAALAGAVILVIMFMAAEMTESRILYQVNAFFVFFWTVCGYASTIGRSFKKES
jgi:O-antigen ligase